MQEENKNNEENKSIDSEVKPEVSEKKEEPKTGIEKLKALGLKEVSNKTFINLENLTYLLDKDFEKLHKTKALGFIQILERDFDVNLADLKDDYLDFQSGGRRKSKKKKITKQETPAQSQKVVETPKENERVLTPIKREKQQRRAPSKVIGDEESGFKIGPYILIFLAGLLGYYLFSSATKDENQLEVLDLNVVQNDTITQKAQENLLATAIETNSSNSTQEVDDEDIDLNKVVQEMFKEADINESEALNSVEENSTTESNSTLEVSKNEAIPTKAEEKDQIIDTQAEVKPTEEIKQETQKVEVKPAVVQKPKQVKQPVAASGGLYIKPTKKAWVGVIYLDNFSKKDYLIRGKLNLDSNRDQIILIGHKNFKIYNGGAQEYFNSKKMVRFIYEGGVLREISKKEYLNRSAGTRW